MARLDSLLKHIKDSDASDLHLVAGAEPRMRTHGALEVIERTHAIEDADLRAMMRELTIEDPIEFVHKPKLSTFSQREVGTHTRSFPSALRAAMRQNPDVILVGELRGREVETALMAAEMGALVFGTLHTNSASKTVDRL